MKVERTVKQGIYFALFSLLILVLGFYLSIIALWDDQYWFARSGCLIVVLGIASGFSGIIQEQFMRQKLLAKRKIEIARVKRKYSHSPAEQERQVLEKQTAFQQSLAELQHDMRVSVGMFEASILVLGTLVWGFGDLIRHFI